MAFPASLTIGTETFERLSDGLWILSTSTADQPVYFKIENTINPDSSSSYLVKTTTNQNSTVAGQPDSILSNHMVIKAPLKVFTEAEILAHHNRINTFMSAANLTKLLRGER